MSLNEADIVPSSDSKILTCNNIVLRRSDVECLRGPHFISDSIIDFYFSHLSSSLHLPSRGLSLVPPAVSFLIANCQDAQTVTEVVGPLQLHDKDVLIFTVNNNTNLANADGGSHWSLLVFDKEMNVFLHHDSVRGHNKLHAMKLHEAVKGFVGRRPCPDAPLFECNTPAQMNFHDCGLYVMAIARVICRWYTDIFKESRWFRALEEEVNPTSVANMRGEVLKLILDSAGQSDGNPDSKTCLEPQQGDDPLNLERDSEMNTP